MRPISGSGNVKIISVYFSLFGLLDILTPNSTISLFLHPVPKERRVQEQEMETHDRN